MAIPKAEMVTNFTESLSAAVLSNSTRKLLWFDLNYTFRMQLFEIILLCRLMRIFRRTFTFLVAVRLFAMILLFLTPCSDIRYVTAGHTTGYRRTVLLNYVAVRSHAPP